MVTGEGQFPRLAEFRALPYGLVHFAVAVAIFVIGNTNSIPSAGAKVLRS